MSSASVGVAEKPSHVPAHLVVDWDFGNPPGADEGPFAALKRLHEGPDIIWTPRNGGHWIATRAADIEHIQKHSDPFSMRRVTLPEEGRPPILPLELDPPMHTRYRTIINGFFTPRAVKGLQEEARALSIELIDGFKHRGHCEFIGEFSQRLPIMVFMKMINQPVEDAPELLTLAESAVRPRAPGDRVSAHLKMQSYLGTIIKSRRANPGDDLLSAVAKARIDGEAISDEDLMAMLTTIMFGGLDTVASSLGTAAQYLADHAAKRQQLIERPELIPNAVDELFRLGAPSSTARIVSRDVELNGIQLKAGDRIWVKPMLHALDERKFDNPLDADWERPALVRNYAAFGNGPHRCPGATLARGEMRIFLEEWLTRIPDFRLSSERECVYGFGMVTALLKLPLEWDPATVL